MFVSPLLWVGTGPDEPYHGAPGVRGVKHASEVPEVVSLIRGNWAVVVPTTDIAYAVLRALGSSHSHARFATSPTMASSAAVMDPGYFDI